MKHRKSIVATAIAAMTALSLGVSGYTAQADDKDKSRDRCTIITKGDNNSSTNSCGDVVSGTGHVTGGTTGTGHVTGGTGHVLGGQEQDDPNPGCFQIRSLVNTTVHRQQQTGTFNFPGAIGAGMTTQVSCADRGDHVTYRDQAGGLFTLTVLSDGSGQISGSGGGSYMSGNVAVFSY